MSDNNLRLQVVLNAVDKLTRPFRNAQSSSKELADAIKKSRDQLKSLNEQAGRIDGFRKTRSELEKAKSNLESARQGVAALAREFTASSNPTKKQARELEQAKRRVGQLSETYNNLRLSVQRQRLALGEAGIDTRKLSDAQRRLKTDTESTTRALAQQQQRLKSTGERQAKMNAVREKYNASNQQRAVMAGLGYTSVATGRTMFNGLKNTLSVGYDFDAMMSKTQAVTRIQNKDDPEMSALRHQARTLPLQSKFTDLQVAEGQYFLGRTGYSAKQIQGAMPGMLNLAAAGDIDLGTTADIASNIQTAMGIPAEKMDHVADVLTALFTRNNVDIPMLGESLKYSAGVGREYGQSLETISAATAMLGSAGIQGSQAGTTMRSILSRIGTSKAVAELGVSTKDEKGNMRDMVDILRDINSKTSKMGNVDRGQIFKDIAGQYAVTGFGVLMHAAGDGSLEKMRGAPGEYDGEAARVSKTMLDNMAGDMTMLHAALENISVELFEKNNGWLRELTKSISGVLHGVAEFLKAHPTFSKAFVTIGAVVAGLTVAFGAVMFALVGILAPITLLRFQLTMLSTMGFKGVGVFGLLSKAFRGVGTAIVWLGRLMFANPILAVIGLIAAGAIYIWQNWDTLGPKFKAMWDAVCNATSAAWEWIKNAASAAWEGIKSLFFNYTLPGLIMKNWDAIKAGVSEAWTTVKQTISNKWDEILGDVAAMPAKFKEYGSSIIDSILNGINEKWEALKNKLSSVTNYLPDWMTGNDKTPGKQPIQLMPGGAGPTMAPGPKYAGAYDRGGYIPKGQWGIAGENGPEIINGPANITSRTRTAALASVVAGMMGVASVPAEAAQLHPMSLPAASYNIKAVKAAAPAPVMHVETHAPITIYTQSGQNAQDIAREVARQLNERESRAKAKARSNFSDQGGYEP
ncbi:phage tail tape measure protein [Cedecea davisae]|uniref:Phage tail tape measure protein n=1 Tax=Cedecea davisae TaxID=158484 RepID=A0ABS6DB85_9ENTR|nr:phage tail tape measure protein [Cedecea davisae]MBU4680477.1 phage tail tape measure protein [Cedecea davisae]MBU4684969.1 phage tail tape measure protein [Cedecea davisae]